jgi:hypothetical protein
MREVTKVCLHLLIAAGGRGRSRRSPVLHRPAAVLPPTGVGVVPKYINRIGTDYSYKQIVHLTSNALIVAVQDSCRGSFRLVRANLKCEPIDAEF